MQSGAGINIHNRMQTGLLRYENVLQTKNPIHLQFTCILGFTFANSQLAMNYFKTSSDKHVDFKKNLINQMGAYSPDAQIRSSQNADKLSLFSIFCIYCLFGFEKQEMIL